MTRSLSARTATPSSRPVTKIRDAGARRFELAVVLAMILLPALGAAVGIFMLLDGWLSTVDHLLFALMYLLTGLGVTVGYHRYFTHRSFKTSRPMQALFAIVGAMAIQGPVIRWVSDHRRHHAFSDCSGDPHSPLHHGPRRWRGWYHAHIGWLFTPEKTSARHYAPDLVRDPLARWIDQQYLWWVALSLLLPAGLGYLLSGEPAGALTGFVWAGLARVFCVQHVTWAVNSICHGPRVRRSLAADSSRNHSLLGLLALGEGWHRNHHSQPSSAFHGMRPGEVDLSAAVIRLLARIGAVWSVRLPRQENA